MDTPVSVQLQLLKRQNPEAWEEAILKATGVPLPEDLSGHFHEQDGAAYLCQVLPGTRFDTSQGRFVRERTWELLGLFYYNHGRYTEALSLFQLLYEDQFAYQRESGQRIEKGTAPLWISECHSGLNHPTYAKRYMMHSLCEDSIRDQGVVQPDKTGYYHRLVWHHGSSDPEVQSHAEKCWRLYSTDPEAGMFPDWVLQHLDHEWMSRHPSADEMTLYSANRAYVRFLLDRIKPPDGSDGDWRELERLGHYLVSCIPGCRARMHRRSKSTEYDVMGVFDGPDRDFRADAGRYFLAECKKWTKKKVDVTTLLKLGRVLDAAKCRFGMLFCLKGISPNAERERVKLFQHRGIAIVVVSEADLRRCAKGANFLTMLRDRYEAIRLDLPSK